MQIAPLGAYDDIQYCGFLVFYHFFQSSFFFGGGGGQNLKFYSQLQF